MQSKAFMDYECTMTAKVTKANGQVYEVKGNEIAVEVTEELHALLEEYKQRVREIKVLEAQILKMTIGE